MKRIAPLLLVGSIAYAGGFALTDQDAAATGRSGAAYAEDASVTSLQYNPAGLAGIQGTSAAAGVTAIVPLVSANSNGTTTNAQTQVAPVPHAYFGYGADKWSLAGGFNVPYGGALSWPSDWSGRYEIVSQNLQVFSGHLGGAYRLTPELSAGATASIYYGNLLVDQAHDFVTQDGTVEMGASGVGFGASAGVTWALRPDARIGLTGSLPVKIPLSGRAHFDNVPPSFSQQAQDQAMSTKVVLPATLGLGGSFQLGSIRLVADAQLTFWSSQKMLEVDFANPNTAAVQQPQNWHDAPTFRLGAERAFGEITGRAGAFYDGSASPSDTLSPSLPDSQRVGVSIGAGKDFGSLHADAAYLFLAFLPRSSSGDAFPATYSATAHMLALTVRYRATP